MEYKNRPMSLDKGGRRKKRRGKLGTIRKQEVEEKEEPLGKKGVRHVVYSSRSGGGFYKSPVGMGKLV